MCAVSYVPKDKCHSWKVAVGTGQHTRLFLAAKQLFLFGRQRVQLELTIQGQAVRYLRCYLY